jgi:Flp pilus assembly protein TadD
MNVEIRGQSPVEGGKGWTTPQRHETLGKAALNLRLRKAARLEPCSLVYEWIGLVHAQMGRIEEAGDDLKRAVALDPKSETAHGSLALWFEKANNLKAAEHEYSAAISLDHTDSWARSGLMRVRTREMELLWR